MVSINFSINMFKQVVSQKLGLGLPEGTFCVTDKFLRTVPKIPEPKILELRDSKETLQALLSLGIQILLFWIPDIVSHSFVKKEIPRTGLLDWCSSLAWTSFCFLGE